MSDDLPTAGQLRAEAREMIAEQRLLIEELAASLRWALHVGCIHPPKLIKGQNDEHVAAYKRVITTLQKAEGDERG